MSDELEICFKCDEPTGNAGAADGSLYDENGDGPYCETCYDKLKVNEPLEHHGKVRVGDVWHSPGSYEGIVVRTTGGSCSMLNSDITRLGSIWKLKQNMLDDWKLIHRKTEQEKCEKCVEYILMSQDMEIYPDFCINCGHKIEGNDD